MPIQMSEKQFRQQFSPEQREAIARLMKRKEEENRAESESSSDDTKESTLPPRPTPSTKPTKNDDGPIAVRVVENHPSVAAQPVKVVSDVSAKVVVGSIHHLEEETKTGFHSLIDIFNKMYGSLKNLGSKPSGPIGVTQVQSRLRPQRTYDPGRSESGSFNPYTRQADKAVGYGEKVWHETVQERYSLDKLKEAVFDPNGFIGGYVHRKFDQKKEAKKYAAQKLRESDAEIKSIDEAANKLAERGASKSDVKKYRDERVKAATEQGIITNLSEKELIKRGVEIDSLRQQARPLVGVIEERRGRGERKEAINRSEENLKLEAINERVAKLDPREAYLLKKYREGKKGRGAATETIPEPTPPPTEPEIGSAEKPYVWESGKPTKEPEIGSAERPYEWAARTEPASAASGDSLASKRSEDATQSTKESQEEAAHFNAEFLADIKKIEENTRPIPDLKKFLDEKWGSKEESGEGSAAPESGGIMSTIESLIPSVPGGGVAKKALGFLGRNAKGIGAVGAGLFGAYDAYTGMQQADQDLAEGKITQEQATVAKGEAIGGGVGMAFGAGFGGAVGSVLGPLGTIGGAWLGGKIGGAIGEVGGEVVTEGAQGLYNGYQWLTGQKDQPDADFMGPLPGRQFTGYLTDKQGMIAGEKWGPIERNDAESIKATPPPAQQSVNNTGIVVNAPTSNTTQVMPTPPKPSFNTDPTFLKYGSSRWGV